jgi:hypothetical protein
MWILFPAVTMSLGWGLRGTIGGGPLGAMIPGAMIAMALCLLLKRTNDRDAAVIAAFGAVSLGFGGQMTYGQTVGFSIQPSTMWWGLLGLGVKGAVWGWLGGAVLGLAFVRDRYSRRDIVVGLALMVLGSWLGWYFINEPKLIYFSNRADRPRPEVWAGLATGATLLLGWLRWRSPEPAPLRFALWGLAGGGFGFFFGGWLQSIGRQHAPDLMRDYWKLMEFTFGFCFGAALGECARRLHLPAIEDHDGAASQWALMAALAPAWLALTDGLNTRLDYTLAGAPLLAIALWSARAAWQIAITITFYAFAIDFLESRSTMNQTVLWTGITAVTAAVAILIWRRPGLYATFLFLTLSATADALLLHAGPGAKAPAPAAVLTVFVIQALIILGMLCVGMALRLSHPS